MTFLARSVREARKKQQPNCKIVRAVQNYARRGRESEGWWRGNCPQCSLKCILCTKRFVLSALELVPVACCSITLREREREMKSH